MPIKTRGCYQLTAIVDLACVSSAADDLTPIFLNVARVKSLSLAGLVPRRTKYVVSSSGVHYNFARQDNLSSAAPHAAVRSHQTFSKLCSSRQCTIQCAAMDVHAVHIRSFLMMECLLQMTDSCVPVQVGHLQPVAWFRFHNRRDYKRWATLTSPKTLWEGQDSDYDIRRTRRHPSTRGASPIPQGTRTHSSLPRCGGAWQGTGTAS